MNKKNKLLKKILFTASLVVALVAFVTNPASAVEICDNVDDPILDSSYEFCMRGIASVFPNDNSVGVSANPILNVTFKNSTTKSTGNIRVHEAASGLIVQTISCSTLTGVGTSFSTPLALSLNTDYYINYDRFCFANATSITNSTIWNFSTRQPLILISSSPFDGETNVCLTKGLTLNFNQPVYSDKNNRGGTIRLSCNGSAPQTEVCKPSTFSGSGTATLFKSFSFAQNTSCNIRISNNCIHNAGDKYWSGTEINFSTNSTHCNTGVCSFPILDTVDDGIHQIDKNLTLKWNTEWMYETAYDVDSRIVIRRSSDDSIYAQYKLNTGIDNTGSLLEVTGAHTTKMTIDPKVDFPPSTSFYVNLNVTLFNCPPFVINDNTTWNFTTGSSGPLMLERKLPRTNRLDVNPKTNIELKFSGSVYVGSGSLRVYETMGDVLVDTIPASSPRIFIVGDSVRIHPVNGLVYNRDYYILVDEGFLNGGSVALPSRAIEKGEWFFKTKFDEIYDFWWKWGSSGDKGSKL